MALEVGRARGGTRATVTTRTTEVETGRATLVGVEGTIMEEMAVGDSRTSKISVDSTVVPVEEMSTTMQVHTVTRTGQGGKSCQPSSSNLERGRTTRRKQ